VKVLQKFLGGTTFSDLHSICACKMCFKRNSYECYSRNLHYWNAMFYVLETLCRWTGSWMHLRVFH